MSLLNVADFPKSEYTAFWDICVNCAGQEDGGYRVSIYKYDDGAVVDFKVDSAMDREDAIQKAHDWLKVEMPKYKRAA